MPRQLSISDGAFHGFYSAQNKSFAKPQTVNLIAPLQLLAAYDRYGEPDLIAKAESAADWFHDHFVKSHPMSIVQGGVRDPGRNELWTKYTAEQVMLSLGLYARTHRQRFMERALLSASFLVQAQRHGFAARYNVDAEEWRRAGWQAFGRAAEALLGLYEVDGNTLWLSRARAWVEHGVQQQAENGCFYLIDADYYNSDLAADPLRALIFLYEATEGERFLAAAKRFADWHLAIQRPDGSWPMTIDRDGNIVCPVVGPGDIANIGISMIRLHRACGDARYLRAALKAIRYSLAVQVTPSSSHPYRDDPNVLWGFWSWQPFFDYTLSGDQSTHHVRGMMIFTDYVVGLLRTGEIERDALQP